ncbi:BAR adaptor protein Hob3 [Massospora cicadina]|nr:BAR adaptor protein Hob3 [Massospora cicadina]
MNRAGTSLMQKAGQVEKTKRNVGLGALTSSQQRIAEVIEKILGDDSNVKNPAVERYRQIAEELDTQVRTELVRGRVIAHFPLINETIKRRNNKLLDHDSARAKAHKLTLKPPDDHQKLVKAEAAAQEAQEAYESVNSQLITEIPRLVDSRLQLLDPSFEALVKAQLQFSARASDSFHSMQPYFPSDLGEDLDLQVESVMHKMRDLTICGLV